MTERERKSPFIHEYKGCEGIYCPKFHVLSAALGCKYNCAYCFLQLSLRYQKKELPIIYTNREKMYKEVESWIAKTEMPSVLNAGELCDLWALDERTKVMPTLIEIFEKQDKHKILFLTKSADRLNQYLNLRKPTPQVILAWSVNCSQVHEDFEKGTPNPFERLATAYTYAKRGWDVRVRVDPIIPIFNWTDEYGKVIDTINVLPTHARVTLGTIRCFKQLPTYSDINDVFDGCIDNIDADKRLRLPFQVRKSIYRWFSNRLKNEPALCKETDKMVDDMMFTNACNCML